MVVSAKGLGLYQPEITNDNYVLLGTLSFITNDDVAIAVTTIHCSTHSATITISNLSPLPFYSFDCYAMFIYT